MAIALTTLAKYLSRTTGLPGITLFTIGGWVRQVAQTAQFQGFFCYGKNNASTDWYFAGTMGDGIQSQLWNSVGQNSGPNFTLQKWMYLVLTVAGTGSGQAKLYQDGALIITADGSTTPLSEVLLLGQDAYSSPENSFTIMENVVVYSDALSLAEIQAQMTRKPWEAPARSSNLNGWYPLIADAKDYSGNGNDFTVNGSPTYHEGPFRFPRMSQKQFPNPILKRSA